MASYRVYKALFPFNARDDTEVSMMPNDYLFVYQLSDGTWPNPSAWMKGTNQRTNMTGDFPGGSYSEFVKEVVPEPTPPPPQPMQSDMPPPPPPRRRAVPTPTTPTVNVVEPPNSPVQRSHDMFKVTLQLPLSCVICDDYVWGSARSGLKCQYCLSVCHSTCYDAFCQVIKCESNEEDTEDTSYRDYAYTVNSFLDFTENDVQVWMKAVNIDVYWEVFKQGGITNGQRLHNVTSDLLFTLGITDELHVQVIMECLNELCRPTQVSSSTLSEDQNQTDLGAWKRLSGQFALGLARSPSNISISNDREAKKRGAERSLNGHTFQVHTFATPSRCDFCSRFMLGFLRQGLKCKNCLMNVHKMCLMESVPHCDQWKTRNKRADVFGTELATQFNCKEAKGPPVVLKCIEAVEMRGLRLEGIYRISPSLGDINKLKDEFNISTAGIDINDSRWTDVHVFSGALKLYLRDLPEPVFTYHMYPEFIQAGRSSKDIDVLYRNIKPIVDKLPQHNNITLTTLLTHLTKVVREQQFNKMSYNNLALVFGPTLIRPKPEQIAELVGNCDVHCRIVEVLLRKGPWSETPPPIESRRSKSIDDTAPPIPKRTSLSNPAPAAPPPPVAAKSPRHLPPAVPEDQVDSEAMSLNDCGWYWQDISREEVTAKLKDTLDGTFLVRDSQRGAFTLTVRKGGQNKLIRIISLHGQFGFSETTTTFASVPDLINYYRNNSLSQYNPRLDVKLEHPISRFAVINNEGMEEEEEDRENDVAELLEKLSDVTEKFDAQNDVYLKYEGESQKMKEEVDAASSAIKARNTILLLLNEQLENLRRCDMLAKSMKDRDRKSIMENVKLLKDRVTQADQHYRAAIAHSRECNNKFRKLDCDLNTLRPILMRLQWQKDQYTYKLIQEGLTHHEISERVKDRAFNESESIYGTLYGTLEGKDEEDGEPEDIYEPAPTERPSFPVGGGAQGPPPPPRGNLTTEDRYQMRPRLLPPQPHPQGNLYQMQPLPGGQPLPVGQPLPLRKHSSDRGASGTAPAVPSRHVKPRTSAAVEDRPHNRQDTWYVECDRAKAEMFLRGKNDGTFLCRPSGRAQQSAKGGLHTHTIDIVYNGIKHLKVVQDSTNKYGFSVPCTYSSLQELIIYYSENSLETHNPKLTTTLAYPLYQ